MARENRLGGPPPSSCRYCRGTNSYSNPLELQVPVAAQQLYQPERTAPLSFGATLTSASGLSVDHGANHTGSNSNGSSSGINSNSIISNSSSASTRNSSIDNSNYCNLHMEPEPVAAAEDNDNDANVHDQHQEHSAVPIESAILTTGRYSLPTHSVASHGQTANCSTVSTAQDADQGKQLPSLPSPPAPLVPSIGIQSLRKRIKRPNNNAAFGCYKVTSARHGNKRQGNSKKRPALDVAASNTDKTKTLEQRRRRTKKQPQLRQHQTKPVSFRPQHVMDFLNETIVIT